MKLNVKKLSACLAAVMLLALVAVPVISFATDGVTEPVSVTSSEADVTDTASEAASREAETDNSTNGKAIAAAIVVGLAASAGAVSMGIAIAKSADSTSRQPEVADKIRSSLMLGLVFIETAIIYALIVAILIIFVL